MTVFFCNFVASKKNAVKNTKQQGIGIKDKVKLFNLFITWNKNHPLQGVL